MGTNLLLVAAYVVLALPYMYRSVDTGLTAIDVRTLTEAAQSLGAGWPTILLRVIFPNLRAALLSGAFLTLAIVIGEFTIASFLVGINAFGPYMSLIGQNKTYESSALAIISFALTWLFMGLLQFVGRGARPEPGHGRTLTRKQRTKDWLTDLRRMTRIRGKDPSHPWKVREQFGTFRSVRSA